MTQYLLFLFFFHLNYVLYSTEKKKTFAKNPLFSSDDQFRTIQIGYDLVEETYTEITYWEIFSYDVAKRNIK